MFFKSLSSSGPLCGTIDLCFEFLPLCPLFSVSWLYYIFIIIVYIVSSFWDFWPWDYVCILFECFEFSLLKGRGPTSSSMTVRNIKMSWFVFLSFSLHQHKFSFRDQNSAQNRWSLNCWADDVTALSPKFWKALFSKGTVYSSVQSCTQPSTCF